VSLLQNSQDSNASRAQSYSEQTGVRHIPSSVDAHNLASRDGKTKGSRNVAQAPKLFLRQGGIKLLD
jgi:hypothetical protein